MEPAGRYSNCSGSTSYPLGWLHIAQLTYLQGFARAAERLSELQCIRIYDMAPVLDGLIQGLTAILGCEESYHLVILNAATRGLVALESDYEEYLQGNYIRMGVRKSFLRYFLSHLLTVSSPPPRTEDHAPHRWIMGASPACKVSSRLCIHNSQCVLIIFIPESWI